MSWLDRLQQAARKAKEQATEGADRLARAVAQHGPGFLGESAAELLAERDYKQARALAQAGLGEAVARQVVGLLLPIAETESHYAAPINLLLGDAYVALDAPDSAVEPYQRARRLLKDVRYQQTATSTLVEALDQVPDELLAEVLVALANVSLQNDDLNGCLRYADEAIEADRRALTAYYLKGCALLSKGGPEDQVIELWLRAVKSAGAGSRETVLGWIDEQLPAHRDWFEKLAV